MNRSVRAWAVIGAVLLAATVLADAPLTVHAHALLLDSTPKAGETVSAPPRLVLRFNGRIEKRLSEVTVVGGPRNTTILLMDTATDRPEEMSFALPSLPPGAYRAQWKVLSVDGHYTEGVVPFTIAPGTPASR
jgi:copper resistance protein C